MHQDDLPITDTLIRMLLTEHAPQWADLPVQRVVSSGTDNAMFRLGRDLVLRIPRRKTAIPLLSKELDWLPHFAGLSLATPNLRYRGRTDFGLKCEFGIFDWMDGETASPDKLSSPYDAAMTLAGFLKELQKVSTDNAPRAGPPNKLRGVSLAEMSTLTLPAIESVSDEIRFSAAVELWNAAVSETYHAPPVWLHGDIKAGNLLAREGSLSAVIDWGLSAVGDPAADYAAAWFWVDPLARNAFKDALELSEGDWLRGKGWALYGAVIALGYYRGGKNEPLCQQCRLTLSRLDLLK